MRIVVLTGAGISAESGLKTFRDGGGLWESYAIEEVATPEAFHANPELVLNFYNERRKQLFDKGIKPNAAHFALAELQKQYPGQVTLITQNVDNLHERAGATKVIHMHGELLKMRCEQCGNVSLQEKDISLEDQCTKCLQRKCLRPHIVWFGETPLALADIQVSLHSCDVFLSIGTSGSVYPAALLVKMAKDLSNAYTVEINTNPTENGHFFDKHLQGSASELVPKFIEQLIQDKFYE